MPDGLSFSLQGVGGILSDLQRMGAAVDRHHERAMYRIGARVKDTAQEFSPISPTSDLIRRNQAAGAIRRLRAKGLRGAKLKLAIRQYRRSAAKLRKKLRRASAVSRAKPGTLQNSITFKHSRAHADIFVPSNSPAGKYAFRIHEEKGSTWHARGPGTIRKGPRADAKFIERAIFANEKGIDTILREETDMGLGL